MTKRLITLLAAAAVAVTLVASTGGTAVLAPKNVYKLVKVGPQGGGGEPSIATASDGTLYVSYPAGSGMAFYRSGDLGKTWKAGAIADPGSGDTTVNVDSSGAVYQSNLNGDLQGDLYKSLDGGKTWGAKGVSSSPTNVQGNATASPWLMDRQWVDAYIPPGKTTNEARVYFTYHDFVVGLMWVNISKDGGKTFSEQKTIMSDPTALAHGFCNVIPGGMRIVQSGPHAGRAYIIWLAGNVATNAPTGCNITQMDTFGQVWAAWSDDEGDTWSNRLIYDNGILGKDASGLFADLALDRAGNPYVTWAVQSGDLPHTNAEDDQWDVYTSASFDGGDSWNGASDGTGAPYKVTSTKGTHVFPAVAAGDPGNVAIAYIATPFVIPQLPYGKPMPGGGSPAEWNVFLARTTNYQSGKPTWTTEQLTSKPFHKGDVCTLGIFCLAGEPLGSNRDILDFIDVIGDPAGMVHVAYTDTEIPNGGIIVANQVQGQGLVAPKLPRKPIVKIPKPRIKPRVLGGHLAGTGVGQPWAPGLLLVVAAFLLVRRLRRTA